MVQFSDLGNSGHFFDYYDSVPVTSEPSDHLNASLVRVITKNIECLNLEQWALLQKPHYTSKSRRTLVTVTMPFP